MWHSGSLPAFTKRPKLSSISPARPDCNWPCCKQNPNTRLGNTMLSSLVQQVYLAKPDNAIFSKHYAFSASYCRQLLCNQLLWVSMLKAHTRMRSSYLRYASAGLWMLFTRLVNATNWKYHMTNDPVVSPNCRPKDSSTCTGTASKVAEYETQCVYRVV